MSANYATNSHFWSTSSNYGVVSFLKPCEVESKIVQKNRAIIYFIQEPVYK